MQQELLSWNEQSLVLHVFYELASFYWTICPLFAFKDYYVTLQKFLTETYKHYSFLKLWINVCDLLRYATTNQVFSFFFVYL